ncbi:fibrobacter succinogenes major paralogous domain-containing protein [Saccharicrinis sp. FJH2]|uniref:fibrobacter succinogenes major paralogous domain-containing protein n=1 Tax=Saccharicrinis sp. FJH65 TaxID=3344659 RepID=UPI0035F2926B
MKKILMIILIGFFIVSCEKDNDNNIVTDPDGNVYKTVTIGAQIWMTENLRTTTYNDGTSIPLVTYANEWSLLSTPAYCWYDNDRSSAASGYGALYNWYTVETGKLCPSGWHVPSDEEWRVLEDYITEQGYDGTEGAVLKATSGWKRDENGTDNYGFSALPAGGRSYDGGAFHPLGYFSFWWSSTEDDNNANYYRLGYDYIYNYDGMKQESGNKAYGFSVRCLRD